MNTTKMSLEIQVYKRRLCNTGPGKYPENTPGKIPYRGVGINPSGMVYL